MTTRVLDGYPIWNIKSIVQAPITTTQRYEPRCTGFILKNAGNTTVILDKGWTIKPGEILNSFNDLPAFENSSFNVQFLDDAPTGETANDRLEIMEKFIDHPQYNEWCKKC